MDVALNPISEKPHNRTSSRVSYRGPCSMQVSIAGSVDALQLIIEEFSACRYLFHITVAIVCNAHRPFRRHLPNMNREFNDASHSVPPRRVPVSIIVVIRGISSPMRKCMDMTKQMSTHGRKRVD